MEAQSKLSRWSDMQWPPFAEYGKSRPPEQRVQGTVREAHFMVPSAKSNCGGFSVTLTTGSGRSGWSRR